MSEQPPQADGKQALKSRLDAAGSTQVPPTRENIIAQTRAEQDAQDQMARALDALHKWQAENAPTADEQAAADALAAQKRQETLQRRDAVIQGFNATKAPGERLANLTPPKAGEAATPLPAAVTGKK